MTSSVDARLTARCLLRGIIPACLHLSYTVCDPAVVRIQLGRLRSWHVSRERLAQGVEGGAVDDDVECASRVHCGPLSQTGRTFLVLRNEHGRWPMSLATDQLAQFLRVTYQLCPASREQQLIEAELEAQLTLFATTQEGS